MSRFTRLCLALCAVLALTACNPSFDVFDPNIGTGHGLRIGLRMDRPGLSMRTADGTLRGFDIDVAHYVAAELGVAESRLSFVEVKLADWAQMLDRSEVDLVVATSYSTWPGHDERVDLAGPYFTAGQSLLVRRQNSDITSPASLNHPDWRLCTVPGTTAATLVRDQYASQVSLREFASYPECVQALRRGVVDAVTGVDIMLAGYAAQQPTEFKLAGQPFSAKHCGIALHKGDPRRAKVNSALRRMIDDGTWLRSLRDNLGRSGYRFPPPPTVGA